MRIEPFYLLAQPVLGVFDGDGHLVKEVLGPVVKLYHPFPAAEVLHEFVAEARAAAGPNRERELAAEGDLDCQQQEGDQREPGADPEEGIPEGAGR